MLLSDLFHQFLVTGVRRKEYRTTTYHWSSSAWTWSTAWHRIPTCLPVRVQPVHSQNVVATELLFQGLKTCIIYKELFSYRSAAAKFTERQQRLLTGRFWGNNEGLESIFRYFWYHKLEVFLQNRKINGTWTVGDISSELFKRIVHQRTWIVLKNTKCRSK
jgi:hypothetical protein